MNGIQLKMGILLPIKLHMHQIKKSGGNVIIIKIMNGILKLIQEE